MKKEAWFLDEEKYFFDKYSLRIDPNSRLGSLVIMFCTDDKPSKLSRTGKKRLVECEKYRKSLVKAQSFFLELKPHYIDYFYAPQVLWHLQKEDNGKETLTGKKASEIYDELYKLSSQLLLNLDEAIEIQKRLSKIRPSQRGGQTNTQVRKFLMVLICLFTNNKRVAWKEIQRLSTYYVQLDPKYVSARGLIQQKLGSS